MSQNSLPARVTARIIELVPDIIDLEQEVRDGRTGRLLTKEELVESASFGIGLNEILRAASMNGSLLSIDESGELLSRDDDDNEIGVYYELSLPFDHADQEPAWKFLAEVLGVK